MNRINLKNILNSVKIDEIYHYIPITIHSAVVIINSFILKYFNDEESFNNKIQTIISLTIKLCVFLAPFKYLHSTYSRFNIDFFIFILFISVFLFLILNFLDSHRFCLYLIIRKNIFDKLNEYVLLFSFILVNILLLFDYNYKFKIESLSLIILHNGLIFLNLLILKNIDEFILKINEILFLIMYLTSVIATCIKYSMSFDYLIVSFVYLNFYLKFKKRIYLFLKEILFDYINPSFLFVQSLFLFIFMFNIHFIKLEDLSHYYSVLVLNLLILFNLLVLKYLYYETYSGIQISFGLLMNSLCFWILFKNFIDSIRYFDLDFLFVNFIFFVFFYFYEKYEFILYKFLKTYIFDYFNKSILLFTALLFFVEIFIL